MESSPHKPALRPAPLDALAPEVYTVEEAAAIARLSEHGFRNAIARNEIPGVVRIGRRIRISRKVFDRWLNAEKGAA